MQWAALALGVVTILYMVVIRPMRKGKSRPDPLERKPIQSTLAQQRAIERDMGNLLVQYEEMIRRMTAQVDTRAKKLEMLIQDAEGTIARLNALIAAAANPAGPSTSPSLTASGKESLPAAPSTGSPRTDLSQAPDGSEAGNPAQGGEPRLLAMAEMGPSQPKPAEAVTNPGSETAKPVTRKPADPSDPTGKTEDRHADIYRLADGGRSPHQIAQELGRPYGEVELILHLRSTRPRQGDLWEQPAPAAAALDDAVPAQAEASNPPEPPPGSTDPRRKGRKKQRSTGS